MDILLKAFQDFENYFKWANATIVSRGGKIPEIIFNGFSDPYAYQEELVRLKDSFLKSTACWINSNPDIIIETNLNLIYSKILFYKSKFTTYKLPRMGLWFDCKKGKILDCFSFYELLSVKQECFPEDEEEVYELEFKKSLFIEFQFHILESVEEYLLKIIELHSNNDNKTNSKYISFIATNWEPNNDNLSNLRDCLIKNNLIESADLNDLKRLFSNRVTRKKIQWIGAESILHYFVSTLSKKDLIKKSRIWKITSNNFDLKDESGKISPIDSYSISRLKPPTTYDYSELDKIFTHLK